MVHVGEPRVQACQCEFVSSPQEVWIPRGTWREYSLVLDIKASFEILPPGLPWEAGVLRSALHVVLELRPWSSVFHGMFMPVLATGNVWSFKWSMLITRTLFQEDDKEVETGVSPGSSFCCAVRKGCPGSQRLAVLWWSWLCRSHLFIVIASGLQCPPEHSWPGCCDDEPARWKQSLCYSCKLFSFPSHRWLHMHLGKMTWFWVSRCWHRLESLFVNALSIFALGKKLRVWVSLFWRRIYLFKCSEVLFWSSLGTLCNNSFFILLEYSLLKETLEITEGIKTRRA